MYSNISKYTLCTKNNILIKSVPVFIIILLLLNISNKLHKKNYLLNVIVSDELSKYLSNLINYYHHQSENPELYLAILIEESY